MITCKAERFDEVIGEIETMLDAHWEEAASYRGRFIKHIHYDVYQELEARGRLVTVTARTETGNLAGYFIGAAGMDPHRNSQSRPEERVSVVTSLVYYMLPKYRGYARSLIHFVERLAVAKYKAEIISIRVKPEANEAGAFLSLLGYSIDEVVYKRLLGEASDARFRKRTGTLEPAVD